FSDAYIAARRRFASEENARGIDVEISPVRRTHRQVRPCRPHSLVHEHNGDLVVLVLLVSAQPQLATNTTDPCNMGDLLTVSEWYGAAVERASDDQSVRSGLGDCPLISCIQCEHRTKQRKA